MRYSEPDPHQSEQTVRIHTTQKKLDTPESHQIKIHEHGKLKINGATEVRLGAWRGYRPVEDICITSNKMISQRRICIKMKRRDRICIKWKTDPDLQFNWCGFATLVSNHGVQL